MSPKVNLTCTIRTNFNPWRFEVDKTWRIRNRNCKFIPFVDKSVLESNCKSFRNTTIRESSNLQYDHTCKIFMPMNDVATLSRAMKKKKKLFPSCLLFLSLEHLSTNSRTCLNLEEIRFSIIFAGQKHNSGTSSAIN